MNLRDRIEERAREAKEKADAELALYNSLPPLPIEPKYVIVNGKSRLVCFDASIDSIASLMNALPPLSMTLRRGTFTSFPLGIERSEGDIPIAPFTIDAYRTTRDTEVTVKWFTAPGGVVAKVHTTLTGSTVAQIVCERDGNSRMRRTGQCALRCDLPGYEAIKWSSGGPEYCNPFTMYWTPEWRWEDVCA
jgi:hypothetical protein